MLLNTLGHHSIAKNISIDGQVFINRATVSGEAVRRASCYVERADSLIGSLTARQTLEYAAKLGIPCYVTTAERNRLVNGMLTSFGLRDTAETIFGRPIRTGLSASEKRRVSIATQLINCPKVIFWDHLTSGLDSVTGFEVLSYLREVAKRYNVSMSMALQHSLVAAAFLTF